MKHYIAGDLGAESGRVMLGTLLPQGVVELREIHRFVNGPTALFNSLRWDIVGIYKELKTGLSKIAAEKLHPASFSVDSWGVDYVWFNAKEPMLAMPYHYRDGRTEIAYESAQKNIGAKTIFEETGIQFMRLNTLYQFLADLAADSPALAAADQFLCIADYLNFLFCGKAVEEISMASTTQVFNPRSGGWSENLIKQMGMPARIFPQVCSSATVLGPMLKPLTEELGLESLQVIATCSHDTGAAVAAVPANSDNWAYLSSGTWSLMGVELDAPLINDRVRELNFTNEIGAENKIRFLRNIVGLWILQESRRHWAHEGVEYDYAALTRMAEQAKPFQMLLNPGYPAFLNPGEMPRKIAEFAARTGQAAPESHGGIARSIFESLALSYRRSLEDIQELTGRKIDVLHVVGGGSKNRLLNQMTADALGIKVIAGPVEATAAGNVLLQAIALGDLPDIAALRNVVRNSFELETFEPSGAPGWEAAYTKFREVSS